MRTESLNWLACPAAGCHQPLAPTGDLVVYSEQDPSELVEGLVACDRCRAQYPVLAGVAVLEADLQGYLWAAWNEIDSCAAEAGIEISLDMRRRLGVPAAFSGQSGPPPLPEPGRQWSTSPYIQTHHDPGALTEDLQPGWWREVVEHHRRAVADPYDFLIGALREAGPARGLALDIGTSAGRGAAELAGLHEYAIGIDRSFRSVSTARRLLLGAPSALSSYRVETEKGRWEERELAPAPARTNLDYVVASAGALPAAAGRLACVTALNMLCAVGDPAAVLDEFHRTMQPGATLGLSTPFWSDTGPSGESALALGGPEFLRDLLKHRFAIRAEEDMVPWLLRLARRRWNVYLCHCVVATKQRGAETTTDGSPTGREAHHGT